MGEIEKEHELEIFPRHEEGAAIRWVGGDADPNAIRSRDAFMHSGQVRRALLSDWKAKRRPSACQAGQECPAYFSHQQ